MGMKIIAVFGLMLISINSFSQFRGRMRNPKIKGSCFCEAESKNKGAWYMGAHALAINNFYSDDILGETPLKTGGGIFLGTNITKNLSFQLGADYYTSSVVINRDIYTKRSFTYIDVPIDFIYRFINDKMERIIPYGIFGVTNSLFMKQHLESSDASLTTTENGLTYNSAYLRLGAGAYFLMSNKFGFFIQPSFKPSLRTLTGKTESTGNYVSQFNLGVGLNYHF